MPDAKQVLGEAVKVGTAVAAWYRSKPLYAGAVIGFAIGQVLYHFLKF